MIFLIFHAVEIQYQDCQITQGSTSRGASIPKDTYNIVQDSDEENSRAVAGRLKSKEDKKMAPRKDGTESILA
jgi:hypothetical protein